MAVGPAIGGESGLRVRRQMDYEEEFTAANARRQLFGKKELPFQKSQRWFLDPNTLNGMAHAIRGVTEQYTVEEMAANCASVSLHVGPVIGKFLGTDAIFTLGYFSVGDRDFCYLNEKTLLEWAENGPPTFPVVDVHAWLTLPSFEIIDITSGSTIEIALNIKEARGNAITMHYSQLSGGWVFHPVILGEDMLPVLGLEQLLIY
jgi:hypothetical protein